MNVIDRAAPGLATLVTAHALAPHRNPYVVYLARLAPRSRRSLHYVLQRAARELSGGACDAESLPWWEMRSGEVAAYRRRLQDAGLAPKTVNIAMTGMSGVLKECWRLGLLAADDLLRTTDGLYVKDDGREPAGREITTLELRALFAACEADRSPAGARDAAIVAVMYACGLRRFEACDLRVEDYRPGTGELIVRQGKGNKWGKLWVTSTGAKLALSDWLAVRGAGDKDGPLFLRINKGGAIIEGRGISPDAVNDLLRKRQLQAEISPFASHDLRRSNITHLRRAGVDLEIRRRVARHSNVSTTARYDRGNDEEVQTALGLLTTPYEGREQNERE
ncbi:MAG TPA: tyrosine-type recombinase/integrase [Dehalococcoidia bacterium]|nr:tyrosine-type recombinase/integrase [Dehalococcoidia bacterium]